MKFTAALFALCAFFCGPCFAADKPLNILVLYADDWRYDTLGCAGNPVVQTPQLDRLAREGMRFTQNRVTTAICGVSRASLFMGNGCRGMAIRPSRRSRHRGGNVSGAVADERLFHRARRQVAQRKIPRRKF